MAARWLFTVIIVAAAMGFPVARGVWMDLPKSGTKCLSEALSSNVVVFGDYYAFTGDTYDANTTLSPTVTVKVTSPLYNVVYHREKVSYGQFSITTSEAGNYETCFSVDGDEHNRKTVSVGLELRIGIAAKDWDSVAKKENVTALEVELRKLEDNVKSIYEKLNYLSIKEWQMKRMNDATNSRVAWWSMMSLACCIVASVLQLWYLRRYFQKKKLI